MPTITELRKQKSKKARYSVFLDNNYACGLDEFCVYKHKLSEGSDITLDELQEIQLESEASTAFEKAINLISKNVKTENQIREYLKTKGYLPKVIDEVVNKLKSYKYINDDNFCEEFIKMYANIWGRKKIKFALMHKGIDEKTIVEKLDNLDNQDDLIAKLAGKFLSNKEITRENLEKLVRHLYSKGFVWADISKVINKYKRGGVNESWE